MSGGSMDYLYSRVRDADFRLDTPLREAFHRHLQLVAEALHDIEWVDSDDKSPGDEDAAILACIACRCAGEREAAAPHSVLVAQLLDPNEPKTEREHAAVRELTAAIARAEAAEATVERCKQVCYATAEGWRETQADLDALVQATGSPMFLEALQIILANKAELDRLTTLRPIAELVNRPDRQQVLFYYRGAPGYEPYAGMEYGRDAIGWTPIPTPKEPTK